MGEKTHTSESNEVKRTDEKVDLRKHRKRITTDEEKIFIMETREKYKQEDLSKKMQRISDEQKNDVVLKKKTKLNSIGFPNNDPYGLSEAFWKIFTKPKVV